MSAQAEDRTQDVFVLVFKNIESFRAEAQFKTWLFQICDNVRRNELRRQSAVKREGLEISLDETYSHFEMPGNIINQEQELLINESREVLRKVVASLPTQVRRCAILRIGRALKYREIAEVMGISIETVKAHLHLARKKLLEGALPILVAEPPSSLISHNVNSIATSPKMHSLVSSTSSPSVDVAELIERFVLARHGGSLNTCAAYRRHLHRFLSELGTKPPTPDALQRYRARLLSDGRGTASHLQALAAVRSFLRWAAETPEVNLPVPPLKIIQRLLKEPKAKLESPVAVLIEDYEAVDLLRHAHTARDRAMVAVFLTTGLRVGELVQLNVVDLAEEGRRLTVRTGRKGRTLPIPPEVTALLSCYLEETNRTWKSPGPLFLSLPRHGGRHSATGRLTPRAVEYRLRKILDLANVTGKPICPQVLRQSYAARFLRECGDLKVLQKRLGHTSLSTTERTRRRITVNTTLSSGQKTVVLEELLGELS